MGNSLRCCLACVLPFGALDLIRVVHLNGRVEEYGRPVSAGEILAANPSHILSKPCSQGVVRRILIVSPESELERGEIYFLIPAASLPEKKRKKSQAVVSKRSKDSNHLASGLPEKKSVHHRRMSTGSQTPSWRPNLECIDEDC